MKKICVFCGSKPGHNMQYMEVARELGQTLASMNIELIYGGADVGTMGAIADGAINEGGVVRGVIPQGFPCEIAHSELTELIRVKDLQERKKLMFEMSDAFITLPGGYGTLDELFELLTWSQLDYHQKPCGLLNVAGYFNPMLKLLDHMVTEGFLKQEHRDLVIVAEEVAELINKLQDYDRCESQRKW